MLHCRDGIDVNIAGSPRRKAKLSISAKTQVCTLSVLQSIVQGPPDFVKQPFPKSLQTTIHPSSSRLCQPDQVAQFPMRVVKRIPASGPGFGSTSPDRISNSLIQRPTGRVQRERHRASQKAISDRASKGQAPHDRVMGHRHGSMLICNECPPGTAPNQAHSPMKIAGYGSELYCCSGLSLQPQVCSQET